MEKKGVAPFIIIFVIFAVFLNFVNLAHALDNEENTSDKADFLADTLYTAPINLEQAEGEQQIEIIIARWGANEKASKFEFSIKSTPAFMENVKLVKGKTRLEFKPHETEKTVVLSFHTKAAAGAKKQDLVLLIQSSDPSLVPSTRKIVLPFSGPRKSEAPVIGAASITVCPAKINGEETNYLCGKSLPVYAGENYKVLLDPGIDWDSAFELRILDSDAKWVGGAVNDRYYLDRVAQSGFEYPKIVETKDKEHPKIFIINPKYTRAGTHTIEIRTKLDDSSDTNGSGLLGSPDFLEFAGEWLPVGTYEVLPAVIHYKGFVAEHFATLKGKGGDFPANTDLEMSTLESIFPDPLVDIIINGAWNRRDCNGNPVLEKNKSRIKISFPEQINLVRTKEIKDSMGGPISLDKAAQFSFPSGGLPFELPVHIISRISGKARYSGCNDIDDAAFDIFFEGLYPLKTDPLKFMTDFKRNWLSLGSSNLKFKHPNPVDPFDLYDPIHNYVRGPDTNIILKAKSLLSEDTIGESIRSGSLFFIPVSFNIAMWKIPKRDARDKFIGDPLMGYAVYGGEPGEYKGPVPSAVGTPKNLGGKDGADPDEIRTDETSTDDEAAATNGTTAQAQTSPGTKSTVTDQSGTPVQGEDLTSPDSDIKSKEPGLDPDQPESLNPHHPKISAIIKEWISVAEPPSNATHGNNFHYSNRGVAIGQGKGFTAKSLHESGTFDPGFLWRNKRALDSVNHCTLGEYVVAKLKGTSFDYCKGRYQAEENQTGKNTQSDKKPPEGMLRIPDLIGKPAKDAKKVLSDKGFKVALQAGKSAPSPEKAFTVTDMAPEPGAALKKGETVKITVFVDYAQQIKIPVTSGLSTVKAKKKLQDSGFKVKLKTKGNSPSPDGAFKTIRTDPAANTKAAKGSTITLTSFGPYMDQVTMPSLVGLKINNAEMVLEKLGLESHSFSDKSAPKKQMKDIVITQEPIAGEIVSPRTRIDLRYYDAYKWKGAMPNLSGLTVAQAKNKMKETGIAVHVLTGIPSSSGRLVNKIYKQSLKKNTAVKQGDSLNVTLYGKTKDQYVAAKDCTGLPGTEPFWNTKTGKPGCRCKGGYLIRNDKSGCDKKEKSIPIPAIVKKDNTSICNQYYNRLNQLVKQQQQISSKMISNPGSTSDYACQALKLGQETILLAKKARDNGCKINGNLEQGSKLMMQTFKQMCKGETAKPPGKSQGLSSAACNRIKNPGIRLDKATLNKTKEEINTVFKKLFAPILTSIWGTRNQDPWKMIVRLGSRKSNNRTISTISVSAFFNATPKDPHTKESISVIYFFNDSAVAQIFVDRRIQRAKRFKGERKSFDGISVYSYPNKLVWEWASLDKTVLVQASGVNRNQSYLVLSKKVHEQLRARGLYSIKSQLSCW